MFQITSYKAFRKYSLKEDILHSISDNLLKIKKDLEMFDLNGVWESDKKLKIATGLGQEEAKEILEDFKKAMSEKHNLRDMPNKFGRVSNLDSREIFLMLMIFLRHYPTFEFLSLLFSIDTSNVKRWIDSSFETLGEILVKKNCHHLMCLDQKRISESDLNSSEKFILTELNKIYEDHRIQ